MLPVGACFRLPPSTDVTRHRGRYGGQGGHGGHPPPVRADLSGTMGHRSERHRDDGNGGDHDAEDVFTTSAAGRTSGRRAVLRSVGTAAAAAASASASALPLPGSPSPRPQQLPSRPPNREDDGRLLDSSSAYEVRTGRPPSVHRLRTSRALVRDLRRHRAVFLGEHHPDGRDHQLQASILRRLYAETKKGTPLAVGIEAVQQPFQHVLDAYVAGALTEEELRSATEWEKRWYWSFGAYAPLFRTCRRLGVPLVALDIASEDRRAVERGGVAAVDPKKIGEYVPDGDAFDRFGGTRAYREYVAYTLRPPYDLQKRISERQRRKEGGQDGTGEPPLLFSNFVARQMLRDEAMASASVRWLHQHPDGLFVGCIGINHATFECGVPGRVARMLSSPFPSDVAAAAAKQKEKKDGRGDGGRQKVASVLINPVPLNTGTDLLTCQKKYGAPLPDDDDDDGNKGRTTTELFPNRNSGNQVCLPNRIGVQNYALQLEYANSPSNTTPVDSSRDRVGDEPALVGRELPGDSVLALADYLLFSPEEG